MKKSNVVLIVLLILAFVVILFLSSFILFHVYDKKVTTSTQVKEEVTKEDDTTDTKCPEVEVAIPKCVGTYYGEFQQTSSNGLSYDLKYTYILKDDFTFTFSTGSSGTRGTFAINDNTISLTGMKDTAGPRDEVTYYYTEDYVLADDCSFILYDNGGARFKLVRQ